MKEIDIVSSLKKVFFSIITCIMHVVSAIKSKSIEHAPSAKAACSERNKKARKVQNDNILLFSKKEKNLCASFSHAQTA